MSDQFLWNRIQDNDHQSFKQVFESHYKPLCSYMIQFTHNMPEAEDIVQNIFFKLWDKRNKITIKTSLKAYLFRSAYNAFMDNYRKQKRNDTLLQNLKYETLSTQIEEDESLSNQKSEKIKNLINILPERCKEILLLSKQKGLKNKEIAKKLGISIKTVESQMRIAFQKIRKGYSSK